MSKNRLGYSNDFFGFLLKYLFSIKLSGEIQQTFRHKLSHSPAAGVSSAVRGLITWQWAPDRRPARQVGQLLSPTRPGGTFIRVRVHLPQPTLPHSLPSPMQPIAHATWRCICAHNKKQAGSRPACFLLPLKVDQAFLTICETHQPLAFTDFPGNSWHGP